MKGIRMKNETVECYMTDCIRYNTARKSMCSAFENVELCSKRELYQMISHKPTKSELLQFAKAPIFKVFINELLDKWPDIVRKD
jgi:hypothetical protein